MSLPRGLGFQQSMAMQPLSSRIWDPGDSTRLCSHIALSTVAAGEHAYGTANPVNRLFNFPDGDGADLSFFSMFP